MADGSHPTSADSLPAPDDFVFPRPLQNWREEGHGRRAAPDEVWAAVREDYLSGVSGPEVCRRHGVGLKSLRQRAAREGWRRADQPWIPPNRLDPLDEGVALEDHVRGDLDKIELRELSYVAHRRMMRAVLRGDAGEALRWRRVRLAMDAEDAEIERLIAQDAAVECDRAGHAELATRDGGEGDSMDSMDCVFPTDG